MAENVVVNDDAVDLSRRCLRENHHVKALNKSLSDLFNFSDEPQPRSAFHEKTARSTRQPAKKRRMFYFD